MSDRLPKLMFALSCAFFVFLYGFCAATFHWPPHGFLSRAFAQFGTLTDKSAPIDPEHHKFPARHPFAGVRSVGAPPSDDVILLTSFWQDRGGAPGIRVIDRQGKVLHEWLLDLAALWPSAKADPSVPLRYVHGCHLFDNGDVLCNIEYLGLLRLDARGQVRWRLERRTHHSVDRTATGDFWVCAARWVEPDEAAQRFPGLEAPLWEDQALLVSESGEVRREVSVLQALWTSEYRALLWSTQYAPRPLPRHDLLHLNDVEELPAALAGDYPLFAAGDLLVSARFVNLVAVLAPETCQIKWAAAGQFLEQHDPDFLGGGWIAVYDNRTDWTIDGSRVGGSRLVAVQPHTGATRALYPRADGSRHERRFYSLHGGKAQALPGDHWLITEPSAGRVFEVDAKGNTVWEWAQVAVAGEVSEVLEGTRYAIAPATVAAWGR